MVMAGDKRRLTAADWVDAGVTALAVGGPDAVAIEPIAVALGTTKGSAYWHWPSRQALLTAALERWREVATTGVIATVEAAGGAAHDRLELLLAIATSTVEQRPGELLTLAHPDPDVRAVVSEVTRERIEYVARLLVEYGIDPADAERRAVLAYSAYLGFAHLAATTPEALPRAKDARVALQHALVGLVTGALASAGEPPSSRDE